MPEKKVRINKETIKKNFSKYAECYDDHAHIQNQVALELIGKLRHAAFSNILEIGCGTGIYTKLLHEKFPSAKITAIDFSQAMIKVAARKIITSDHSLAAKNIEFMVADGEVLPSGKNYDLICSNVSFQWFHNLAGTIAKYKSLLKDGGMLLFSMFGPRTYHELDASVKKLGKKDAKLSATHFIDKEMLQEILDDHFEIASVEETFIKEDHPDLTTLLNKIKFTGTRGQGLGKKIYLGPKTLNQLEKIYKSKFKNIVSTYHIFYGKAVK